MGRHRTRCIITGKVKLFKKVENTLKVE